MSKVRDEDGVKELIRTIRCVTGRKIISIKRGTRGIVLIAETGTSFPRYVAYKTTLEVLEGSVFDRFIKEVRRMFYASGHPLILTPYYIIKIGGKPLICMRYMDKDLRQHILEHGKLDIVESLVLGIQIVKGLLYLKSRGIKAHQDLKPENILLEDLRKLYGNEIRPPLHLRARIADFGLANAWKEAGIPGGTNPYRAPEQFARPVPPNLPEEYFNPDVFALGIILVEMIAGVHPSGLTWDEVKQRMPDTRFWENWALNGERKLDKIANSDLKELIAQMLDPLACKRPPLEEVYEELLRILGNVDQSTAKELKSMLDDYERLAEFYLESGSWISHLLELTKISHDSELKGILATLKLEREKVEKPVIPSEAVYLCKVDYGIGSLMARIDKVGYKNQIIEAGKEIIDTLNTWCDKITVEHVYMERIENLTSYEAHADLLRYALKLLSSVLAEDDIAKIISNYDDYIKSLYHFLRSVDARYKGADIREIVKEMNVAIGFAPTNPVPRYIKAFFIYDYLILMTFKRTCDEFIEVNNNEVSCMLREALTACKEAIEIDEKWECPKELLKDLKELSEKLLYQTD